MEKTSVMITTPMGLFAPAKSTIEGIQASADMAERLRADYSGELRRELMLQLDDMHAHLRAKAERGADASTYEQIEAGLLAVGAAREILSRMPVTGVDHHPRRLKA